MTYKLAHAVFTLAISGSIFLGCGADDAREQSSGGSQLSADSDLSSAATSASLSEGLESLSDSNLVATAAAGLSLADTHTVTKTCAVSGDTAVVNLNHVRDLSWVKEFKRFSISSSNKIDHAVTRTWSKEGTAIACNNNAAAIDFEADLTAYKVDIVLKRNAERSFEKTLLRTGDKTVSSSAATSSGTRQITWTQQSTLADGSISRSKTISFSVQRSISLVNKSAEKKSMDITVATKAGAPLDVTVTWDKLSKGRALLSKLIKSGTLQASKAGGGVIETSFNNILLQFTTDSCQIASGSLEAKVFAEGATEASLVYKVTALGGEVTVEDVTDAANPKEVEDFEYSPCDLKDFKN